MGGKGDSDQEQGYVIAFYAKKGNNSPPKGRRMLEGAEVELPGFQGDGGDSGGRIIFQDMPGLLAFQGLQEKHFLQFFFGLIISNFIKLNSNLGVGSDEVHEEKETHGTNKAYGAIGWPTTPIYVCTLPRKHCSNTL